MNGSTILIVSLILACLFGVYRALTDGHVRTKAEKHIWTTHNCQIDLGEKATLLQFSSSFCQPCRATKVLLADIAAHIPGVTHVEINAEEHLPLVRELGISRTPTTLILDKAGTIRGKASGLPKRSEVTDSLALLL
jgi:thiol-disulfide isomerase/thioredoxin